MVCALPRNEEYNFCMILTQSLSSKVIMERKAKNTAGQGGQVQDEIAVVTGGEQ